MNSNDTNESTTAVTPPNGNGTQTAPAGEVSQRKLEANRQNAQLSTGPKTPEGKAKSSRNSVTHGLFVKLLFFDAESETIEEMEALTAGLREHFQTVGMMEELLMEKVVAEMARYRRILAHETIEFARKRAFSDPALDCVGRYSTAVNRSLFRAIEELERLQTARKAVQGAAASSDEETPETAAKNLPEE
jgi:hypothetical protein